MFLLISGMGIDPYSPCCVLTLFKWYYISLCWGWYWLPRPSTLYGKCLNSSSLAHTICHLLDLQNNVFINMAVHTLLRLTDGCLFMLQSVCSETSFRNVKESSMNIWTRQIWHLLLRERHNIRFVDWQESNTGPQTCFRRQAGSWIKSLPSSLVVIVFFFYSLSRLLTVKQIQVNGD